MMPRSLLLLSLAVPLAACGTEDPQLAARGRVDLAKAMNIAAPAPIGIAIAPDSGRRFVFDMNAGLYELTGSTATPITRMTEMPQPDEPIRPPFTDLVALPGNQFALTAIGDGFVLDPVAATLQQRFCYEPGGFPDDLEQRTDAVAYDPAADRLFAQPRTFDPANPTSVLDSQIGVYDRASGEPLQWYSLDHTFVAGGMTVTADQQLWLGQHDQLYRFDFTAAALQSVADLSRFGIHAINALAIDRTEGSLLVVDVDDNELVEIGLDQL